MRALVMVGLQRDFLPGGAMPVPRGDAVIPLANRLQGRFKFVVATQEWHPLNHASFAANHSGKAPGDEVKIKGTKRILRPSYCVQNTEGAKLAPDLQLARVNRIFTTGTEPEVDSYSAFFDQGHLKATGLGTYLKAKKVREVYVLGLATEHAVKFTALDARMLGFKVFVIEDACRGMDRKPGDAAAAVDEMKKSGIKIVRSRDVLKTGTI